MFEVLLEIRVSRCTSACQCSGGSSPELSADLELQPGERADRPRGLLCVIAKVPITIIPLRREFSQRTPPYSHTGDPIKS